MAAVLLSRDRPERALRALDSLADNDVVVEALVIDNNSAPAAAAALARGCSERDHVTFRRSDRNLRCAGGRRLGCQLVSGELVLFLDDDAELTPGALDLLVAELDGHPDVGAVTATVEQTDRTVHHSGGDLRVCDGVAEFSLVGAGQRRDELPPSGAAGWVPGTAVLIRHSLLDEFPFDPEVAWCYHEDNEWCYRVERSRPGSFRRSREAVAIHHVVSKVVRGTTFAARSAAIDFLCGHARFYQRHGVLLGMSLPELVPELATDGGFDRPAARLMMELMLAKGPDWVLAEWMNGGLDVLLSARRRLNEITTECAQRQRWLAEAQQHAAGLERQVGEQASEIAELSISHETLVRIEAGGWWRLRVRLLRALTLYRRLRRESAP